MKLSIFLVMHYLSVTVLALTHPRNYSATYYLMRLIAPLFYKSVRQCTTHCFVWVNVWCNCGYSMVLLICVGCWFQPDPFQVLVGFLSSSKPQDESQFSSDIHTVILTVPSKHVYTVTNSVVDFNYFLLPYLLRMSSSI